MNRSWLELGVLGMCLLPLSCGSSADGDGVAGGGASSGGTGGGGGISGGSWGGAAGSGGSAGQAGDPGTGGSGNTGNTGGTGGSGNTSGSGGSGNTSGSGGSGGGSYPNPICLQSASGAYCGNDEMQGADPNVLYQCPGANQSPTSSTPCDNGCVVEAQGKADHCKVATTPGGYKLPWKPGVSMQLTQDCKDSCCNDHVGDDQWAWDFANGGGFTVVAARGGTITHLKINSSSGCGASSCQNDANFIVIDHGDGTQSTYLHLAKGTLASGVTCGATVQQGQALATAGTTGWSTGIHLHFQVSQVHSGAATCECGSSGTGCGASTVPWGSFWSTPTYPTVPVQFDEWPASTSCADRHYIPMPASQNQ